MKERKIFEPRKMDLSACEEIGRGQCSSILKVSEDRVVKLCFETIPEESIIRECEHTFEASRLGINSVRCFGLVTWAGRLGIELEFVKGRTLVEEILTDPARVRGYAADMAEELKNIHLKKPDPAVFPPIHEFYLDCTKKCVRDGWITSSEAEKIVKFIEGIPLRDTMVHADYHILNIMVSDGKIRLIDLADCMSGHPVYDLLITNLYMHWLPVAIPDMCGYLFKTKPEQNLSCWDKFVRVYFGTEDEREIEKINEILNVYSMLKLILAPFSFSNMSKEEQPVYVSIGRKELMPVIEKYTGIIPKEISELGKISGPEV